MELLDAIRAQLEGLHPAAALLAIVLATFVSEDLTCVAAGLLAAAGEWSFGFAATASGLGIFLGDLWLYGMGRVLGPPALARAPLRWIIDADGVARGRAWFQERGPIVILLGRFVPGSRLPTYFASGVLATGFAQFSFWALLAVLIWSPLLVGLSVVLGREVLAWIEVYERWAWPALLGVLAVLAIVFKVLIPMCTWRGRRLWVGRARRWTRFEFWPLPVVYGPVVLAILWEAIRHRSLSVATAVNPCMPAGGWVGESKADILEGLDSGAGEENPKPIARFARIPPDASIDARWAKFEASMGALKLAYPVVLKPDVGQRGQGVAVIRSPGEGRDWLRSHGDLAILQEYVSGEEYGVFWLRPPGAEGGRIFSITAKRFPSVVGDGVRTLEHLILGDERAVCMADVYRNRFAERLFEIPGAGEVVPLAEIGNHCLGAVFLNGAELATPALTKAIDELSLGYRGFHFGRYDLRVPSAEDLAAGRGFKVIELNGATSEATHIYDPEVGALRAWGTLIRQWRWLFRIAAHNARQGATVTPWYRVLRDAWSHRGTRGGTSAIPGTGPEQD